MIWRRLQLESIVLTIKRSAIAHGMIFTTGMYVGATMDIHTDEKTLGIGSGAALSNGTAGYFVNRRIVYELGKLSEDKKRALDETTLEAVNYMGWTGLSVYIAGMVLGDVLYKPENLKTVEDIIASTGMM